MLFPLALRRTLVSDSLLARRFVAVILKRTRYVRLGNLKAVMFAASSTAQFVNGSCNGTGGKKSFM
jgi:hypothetical protein